MLSAFSFLDFGLSPSQARIATTFTPIDKSLVLFEPKPVVWTEPRTIKQSEPARALVSRPYIGLVLVFGMRIPGHIPRVT